MAEPERASGGAGHDLDLAVELVNTHWVLARPPDRLTDITVAQRILRDAGDGALAAQLTPGDLPDLLALRAGLHPVFAAATAGEAAGLLDELLRAAAVPARITAGPAAHGQGAARPADAGEGLARWDWGAGQQGMAALRARLLGALAGQLIRSGVARLGVCQAPPCRCVYVDRSRARVRRYCCDQCNDRAAAAAYRSRKTRSAVSG